MNKKIVLLLCCLLLIIPSVQALPFIFSGYVVDDCSADADINITVFFEGTNSIADTTTINAAGDGAYGTALTPADNSLNYDINITATNAACSPSASGVVSLTSVNANGLTPVSLTNNVTMSSVFANAIPTNNSVVGSNLTAFSWTSDYIGLNYTLEIATTNSFGGSIVFSKSVIPAAYTIVGGEELANGNYYWRVRAINTSGATIDTSSWSQYTLMGGSPSITSISPSNNSWRNSSAFDLSLTTSVDAFCGWSTSSSAFNAKTIFTSTNSTTHQTSLTLSSEDANTIYLQCNNSITGTTNLERLYVFNRDTAVPTSVNASVSIDGGAASSNDTTLDFTWSGFTDAQTSISNYYYSFTDNSGTTSGTLNSSPNSGSLSSASQGTVSVYVWAEDAVGNIGAAAQDTITVDSLPPSFSGWSSIPADLTKYSTGSFQIIVTVTDISNLNAHPIIRHRLGSDAWSTPAVMTLWATNGNNREYRYSIAESASPNTWFERNGENLTYEINVSDIHGFSNSITRNEFINDQSTAPTIDAISNKAVIEDSTLQFNLSGSDVDLNTLTFSCNVSGVTITSLTDSISRFTWTPDNDDVGVHAVMCNVTDGTFSASETFSITVTNLNDDPVLLSIGNLYAQEYEFFNYTLNASDADNDSLQFLTNGSLFSINKITGKIAFTPFSKDRGDHAINISVSDGNGGVDFESLVFTVGYCGDAICKDGYETCGTCELDCGICGEQEKKHIIVQPRNCLDERMEVQAVTLVPRATCDVKGIIVDDMEVCGNESSTSLKVFIKIEEDTWEETTQIITDEDGFASFIPAEEGKYKISFSNDQDSLTLFEIESCIGTASSEETTTTTPSKPKPITPTIPPVIEEPAIQESVARWNMFSILLYFLFIPILLVTLVISSVGYFYREERKKGKQTGFVKQMDALYEQWFALKKKILVWMKKTPPFNTLLVEGKKLQKEFTKSVTFVVGLCTEYWFEASIALGMQRKIRLQYYPLPVEDKKLHLLTISLLKNLFPKRSVDELLALIHQYTISSIMDITAMVLSFGIKATYCEPQPKNISYINALISKGVTFKSRPCTRIDFESALLAGYPVVCMVNELGKNGSVIQSIVILYSFDKNNFYYHDYLHNRQGLKATKDQFMHAWTSAGQKALFMKK